MGGEACPKIIVRENGVKRKEFGWETSSTSWEYKYFLESFLPALVAFLKEENMFKKCFMHLTDEPNQDYIEKYVALAEFVKKYNGGMLILDALSHYEFFQKKAVDLPVVATNSKDLPLFNEANPKMLYYCLEQVENYLSNRLFDMPLQRTAILGMQLYETGVQGFLHWGVNFYNAQYSVRQIDPYVETTAGGNFPAGDSFIVYPGKDGVEYSIRYFAMQRAYEDYRLLKTVEEKYSREEILNLLHQEGVKGLSVYPRDVNAYENCEKNYMRY